MGTTLNLTDTAQTITSIDVLTAETLSQDGTDFVAQATDDGLLIPASVMLPYQENGQLKYKQKVIYIQIPNNVLKQQLKIALENTNVEWRE